MKDDERRSVVRPDDLAEASALQWGSRALIQRLAKTAESRDRNLVAVNLAVKRKS